MGYCIYPVIDFRIFFGGTTWESFNLKSFAWFLLFLVCSWYLTRLLLYRDCTNISSNRCGGTRSEDSGWLKRCSYWWGWGRMNSTSYQSNWLQVSQILVFYWHVKGFSSRLCFFNVVSWPLLSHLTTSLALPDVFLKYVI